MLSFKGKNSAGSSLIHQLDPRLKIVISFFTAFLIALSEQLTVLYYFLFLAVLLVIITKIEFKFLFKKLLMINFFIIIIWLFIPATFPGRELFRIWNFSFSEEGIKYALKITLRSNAIMLFIISFLTTNTISELIHALYRLKVPRKLIYLFAFVYRYLDIIKKEYNHLQQAVLLRAFKPKTNLHSYKTYAYLIAMLLIRSYERSEKVYEALICRGFKGKFVFFDEFEMTKLDLWFSLGFLVSLSVILFI